MNSFVPIRSLSAVAAACTLALSGASVAAPTASTTAATDAPNVLTDQPNRTPAMEQLLQSADRLRQSIQALAQQSPGPHRDAAIESARQALNETQRAMIDLPPELRAYEGSLDWVEYGQAMERLRAHVRDEDIARLDQRGQGVPRRWSLEVEADRSLTAVEVKVGAGVSTRGRRPAEHPHEIPPRRLDLDHVRSVVREAQGADRADDHRRQV